MTDVPTLFFEPSARLQRFLGRELIADPNLAMGEFVKNAYDAGATQVYIDFAVAALPRECQTITISDNGTGMNLSSFETNWMRPGYSYKAVGPVQRTPSAAGVATEIRDGRVPIGEKGIGRLAAGRLGERLDVFTRERPSAPWLHVVFDWARFDDMGTALSRIPIEYDERGAPAEPRFEAGTIIKISQLTLDWTGKVPGRKVRGRSDFRIGRLREDLSILLQPLSPVQQEFTINLGTDSSALNQFAGGIESDTPTFLDYMYDFTVTATPAGVQIIWRLSRSPQIAATSNRPDFTEGEQLIPTVSENGDLTDGARPSSLRCGTIHGKFFYSPESARRAKLLGISPGVHLYRDGIRVDPYGHVDDDWLGARARKASRQGYAAIQPNYLSGYVRITKEANPLLLDMSNRQGLLENDAYDDFIAHVRAEFRRFEDLIFEEYVEPQWEPAETKTQRAAQRAQGFSVAVLRALVHALRQPIAGLSVEADSLKYVIDNIPLDVQAKVQLAELHERFVRHLYDINTAVTDFFEFDVDPEIEAFNLQDALEEAVRQTSGLAKSLQIEVRLHDGPAQTVAMARHVLVEAISELIRNGVQAPRPEDRLPGWVDVRQFSRGGSPVVAIEDNGGGVDSTVVGSLFAGRMSTKGRPGVGLLTVRELLALFLATVSLTQTSREGSVFEISLPAEGDLRKERT